MALWLDLLRTPMAAPETAPLRRMRFTWQALCLSSALAVGFFGPFHRIAGQAAPITVIALLVGTLVQTVWYFVRKNKADRDFLKYLGEAQ